MIRKTAGLLFTAAISGLIGQTAEFKIEAENAVLTGVNVSSSASGFSGTGFVTGFDQDGDRVEFRFQAEAGLYELFLGFATPYGQKGFDLIVNGAVSTGLFPAVSGGFSEIGAGKTLLRAGENVVTVGKGWGWFHLDYLRIVPSGVRPPLRPPKILIDPRATPSARSLYSWLVDQYGSAVLAGQQDLSEIEYVRGITGRSPAVGVFDLIEYSPSRIRFGSNPGNAVERWMEWSRPNGIVSLSWHWNAPTDLKNGTGTEWWRGFYADAVSFDLAAVMADTTSERYRMLVSDMDAIAVQLRKFAAADVPVLWRPLHEASGGWFWWGAKGPGPFKALWRLLVRRLRDHHGLHHLVWVYTAGDPEWYPGDDAVDVVSLDVYTDASSSMSNEWENIQAEFDGRKPVALSESGTLPDPAKMRTYGIWWSWFSVWSGEFIRGASPGLLRRVYADTNVVTLDELPDWREYDPGPEGGGDAGAGPTVHPNPGSGPVTVRIRVDRESDVRLSVFDLRGRRVAEMAPGRLPAGPVSFSLDPSGWPAGVYLVSVKSAGSVRTVKFTHGCGPGRPGPSGIRRVP